MSIEIRTPPSPREHLEKPKRKSPWLSRKFWLATISFTAVFVNQTWGIQLDPIALAAIVLPIVAYIIGESFIDAKHKEGKGND
ncbi:MAG: hypothetical protein DDT29_02582 [Dehalococcoidia bacterium]|nr:hypothetical protein [Bacillota bacterium]